MMLGKSRLSVPDRARLSLSLNKPGEVLCNFGYGKVILTPDECISNRGADLAMAETLGTLADKLTTVKLKLWHTEDAERARSLRGQEEQLKNEIDEFIGAALAGEIPLERLTFAANKVYKKEGNVLTDFQGSLGQVFSQLAEVNCRLWHVQEKVYEFEQIPMDQKDDIIKQLAIVNLERNQCIDRLDEKFRNSVETLRKE